MGPVASAAVNFPRILFLGTVAYNDSLRRMKSFAAARDEHTRDEFWVLEHPPVYTQGTSCDDLPSAGSASIPVVKSDRGGQITYHGPGQLIVYLLLDIKRLGIGPKRLVSSIERAVIRLLNEYGVTGAVRAGAPGVYVEQKKVAALGLRVRRGSTYHGLSLNIDMDLEPFDRIDPCGYRGLEVTQLRDLGVSAPRTRLVDQLLDALTEEIYAPISGD